LWREKIVKILIVDIETAPNLAFVWGLWKNNVGINQIKEYMHVMSYAAKWLCEDKIVYKESRTNKDKTLIKSLVKLFDEADIVVAHNGKKFDFPTVMARAIVHNIAPPSPYKVVDTLLVARREFRFPSNSLAALAIQFKVSGKLEHKAFPGFALWSECLKGNPEAWDEMKAYNIQDIVTLEEVYLKMLPWMRYHPNVGVFDAKEEAVCPKCGGTHLHFRGYSYTNVGKYHRFQCQDCNGWGRTRFTILEKDKSKALVAHAVT